MPAIEGTDFCRMNGRMDGRIDGWVGWINRWLHAKSQTALSEEYFII